MRYWIACAAMTVALTAGCTEPASFGAELLRPLPSRPMSQNCLPDHRVDYPVYTRTIGILQRSGDIDHMLSLSEKMRAGVDGVLTTRNAAALAELKPVMDGLFSAQGARIRAICDFTQSARDTAIIDAWDAWVSDATMRDIHARIVGDDKSGGSEAMRIDDARRVLFRRILAANGGVHYAEIRSTSIREAEAIVTAALDPASPTQMRPVILIPVPASQEDMAVLEQWLARQLAGVSDKDLKRYLAFAESEAGMVFYQSLRTTYTEVMNHWFDALRVSAKEKIAPKMIVLGPDAVAAAVAKARLTLDGAGALVALQNASRVLTNIETYDPGNPEIHTVLGRVTLDLIPLVDQFKPPYEKGQIRDGDAQKDSLFPQRYLNAERSLATAIRIDPNNAEAHVFMGRSQFLRSADDDAARHFAEARKLDPDNPYLALFEGDLAYATGHFAQAEKLYRDLLAKPDGRRFDRYLAIQHLGNALNALGRGREFGALAETQLQRSPDMWALRLDHAEDLLDRDGSAAAALAVVEAAPNALTDARSKLVMTRIQVQKVVEASPSAKAAEAKRVNEVALDTELVGVALCRARSVAVIDPVIRSRTIPDGENSIATPLLACAVRERRPDAVAAALPFIKDINAPLMQLRSETALCAAAARRDDKTLTLLLKAKADPERRCSDGKTTARELLAAMAAKGDAEARAALSAFEQSP